MKTYQIKMSRSRWFSLLLAVLMIVMIVELCTPYFTYGKQTLSFVPPEGGNEKILNGTWKLSGSDETQDGYKEIVINSGKMTVKTTNIIRVNQLTADEAVKAAAEAMDKAEAAAKEGEKTYQKKAEKAASDSEKELAKLQKTALELLPETVFEELANDYQAAEVAALQYEAYDNTSSEKAMMETEGKAKYNEKKSTLSLTFANGQKIDTNFGASFGYNEIKHLSILGYVGFPYEVEDFSEEMTYRIENFYINDVVLIPIILLVLCIIGIVMCALKKDKLSAGIVPAILGVVGVIGYLTSDFLKLGDKYTVHIILFAVIFAVAVLHIVLSAKKAKKA